jgi:NitT/TauT family transport system substrate-binding protein
MKIAKTATFLCLGWLLVISFLHAAVNLGIFDSERSSRNQAFRIGFLPVTCHLTCPVTHFINKNISGKTEFEPIRFSAWPELKESFLSGYTPATFILAPMAMRLREDGVPIKIVHLGHRDGTALMVHKDSGIFRFEDLRGKTIAVPNRFSNQRLLIFKALKDHGMTIQDVNLVEMPPPDMPAAIFTRSVDAVSSGEPFMGQTELDGYGRVLYLTKDIWPNFISCVLAVREDMIRDHRDQVQRLVDGIARSGAWIDQSMDHRMQAAEFVSQYYYNQHPRLLQFVLSKPPDRVRYTNLSVRRKDFEEIAQLGKESGILRGTATFDDYADPSFMPEPAHPEPYQWEFSK